MARKTKNNKKRNTRLKYKPARRSALRFPKLKKSRPLTRRRLETPIYFTEDVYTSQPKPTKIAYEQSKPNKYKTLQHGFKTTNLKANICKRRSERKEIIHALGKSGYKGQKIPNNKTRYIKC